MPTPLTLVATLITRDGHAAAVEAGLRQLVDASRAEVGCLQYDLHQHRDNPQVFVMLEQWLDAAALSAHQQSPHFQAFGARCGDSLQSVDLQFMHRLV
ncbi:antibiotic biosynthesis monooxygenase [Pseudomonas sp. CrR25]|nr:antibiotic biosynthesis monooxygenase [Pseudomonas sp. CrR25]